MKHQIELLLKIKIMPRHLLYFLFFSYGFSRLTPYFFFTLHYGHNWPISSKNYHIWFGYTILIHHQICKENRVKNRLMHLKPMSRIYAFSFYRSQSVLDRSKLFLLDEKLIYVQSLCKTFQKMILNSEKSPSGLAQKVLNRH